MNIKRSLCILMLTVILGPGVASAEIRSLSTVTLVNNSSWAIHHVYISSSSSRSWGRCMLGRDILHPGLQFKLYNIACDFYDVKLIDEDGDTCVLKRIDLCRTNQRWVLNDVTLLTCEMSTSD